MTSIHFVLFISQRPGLGFPGVFLVVVLFFFIISMLDNGRSGCLYVKASHNVKAVNECSFTREFCGAAVPAMPS